MFSDLPYNYKNYHVNFDYGNSSPEDYFCLVFSNLVYVFLLQLFNFLLLF